MNSAYKRVIEIISEDDLDYKAIVIAIAKDDPATFLKYADKRQPPKHVQMIYESIVSQNKVQAIKDLRATHNLGLKDAKDIVDHIELTLAHRGVPGVTAPQFSVSPLRRDLEQYYDEIVEFQATAAPLTWAEAAVSAIVHGRANQAIDIIRAYHLDISSDDARTIMLSAARAGFMLGNQHIAKMIPEAFTITDNDEPMPANLIGIRDDVVRHFPVHLNF